MGWSDVKIAMRYIHPTEDHVLAALSRIELSGTGDQSGDNPLKPILPVLSTGILSPSQ
jgi:hypothetical protein